MSVSATSEFLAPLRGRSVFFDPLHGNHGDHLLRLGARFLLDNAGISLAETPGAADFILINGGGSMADGWFGLEKLARYCSDFPSTPLAVLPSSFHSTPTRLLETIGTRPAPVHLWAREMASLDLLNRAGFPPQVHLYVDHDLAFQLDCHPLVTGLRVNTSEDHVLIVERDDWEGPTGRSRPFSPSGLDFIPERCRTAVRRTLLGPLRRRQDRESAFASAASEWVGQRYPGTLDQQRLVQDISLAETCSFEQFLEQIARSSVVVTTRLHVAILAHLLQRRTFLVEGSYHKNRAVFEYSMQQGNTKLLRWNSGELSCSGSICPQ